MDLASASLTTLGPYKRPPYDGIFGPVNLNILLCEVPEGEESNSDRVRVNYRWHRWHGYRKYGVIRK